MGPNVKIKSVYGVDKIYPVNKEAQALANIAGTKTLDPRVLRIARDSLDAGIVGDMTQDQTKLAQLLKGV